MGKEAWKERGIEREKDRKRDKPVFAWGLISYISKLYIILFAMEGRFASLFRRSLIMKRIR